MNHICPNCFTAIATAEASKVTCPNCATTSTAKKKKRPLKKSDKKISRDEEKNDILEIK